MMLQEEIQFDAYFRCYYLGGRIKVMQYEPRNPFHERYVTGENNIDKKLIKQAEDIVRKLNESLGYDFNTVELAVRDGVCYAIDFCNPAPDADLHSVGEENFEWVLESAATMAIERAKSYEKGKMNLTWGQFMKQSVGGKAVKAPEKKAAAAKKTTTTKKTAETKETAAATKSTKTNKATTATKTTKTKKEQPHEIFHRHRQPQRDTSGPRYGYSGRRNN